MIGHQQGHLADLLAVHSPVPVVPLQLPPGVGAGPDQGHGQEETVPEGTEDTLVHIPEAGRDHVATGGTEEGTMSGTTGGTTALLQDTDHAAGHGLVEDRITEGPIREADHVQEAEDTMDLGEQYIPRLTGAGEAGHEQDLGADHPSI